MVEAWQVRSIERQKLLEELMREVYQYEDENPSYTSLQLAKIIIEYFFFFELRKRIPERNYEACDLFEKNFLPKIKNFARAEAEVSFLLAEFLKKILGSALTPIYSTLMALEFHNPQLIFHASSAMAPAELPENF